MGSEMIAESIDLRRRLVEAREVVMDLFNQACLVWVPVNELKPYEGGAHRRVYDHQCISTYENAQDYLIEHGLIESRDCVRK